MLPPMALVVTLLVAGAILLLLETILPRDRSFEDYVVDHEFPGVGRRRLLLIGAAGFGDVAETEHWMTPFGTLAFIRARVGV